MRERRAVVEHVNMVIPRVLVRTASDAHYGHMFAADLDRATARRPDELNPYARNWLAAIRDAAPPFLAGCEAEVEIADRLGPVLAEYDALRCPAFAVPAFTAGTDHTVVPFTLDGLELDTFHDLGLTEVFNAVNRCPVLCVPAGRAASGVPIGVQIAGRTMDDPTVFRIGAAWRPSGRGRWLPQYEATFEGSCQRTWHPYAEALIAVAPHAYVTMAIGLGGSLRYR